MEPLSFPDLALAPAAPKLTSLGLTVGRAYSVSTFVRCESDGSRKVVIAWQDASGGTFALSMQAPLYIGQGGMLLNTPQGQMPHQFEFAIPGAANLSEAFDQFMPAMQKGATFEIDNLRKQALRQGADLSQLPRKLN